MKLSDISEERIQAQAGEEAIRLGRVVTYFEEQAKESGFELTPEYQRVHVWSEAEQIAFVEHFLSKGEGGRIFYINRPSYYKIGTPGLYSLVDGLQRLTALQKFVKNELPVFGGYFLKDLDDAQFLLRERYITVRFNELDDYADVLKWYIQLNSTGRAHTPEELEKVKTLLEKESK